MKIKSKIVLFVCAFALIFSVVSVSCFAQVDSLVPGERYLISSSLTLPSESVEIPNIVFAIDGSLYSGVSIYPDSIVFGSDTVVAYLPALGWVDESLQPISVPFITLSYGFLDELSIQDRELLFSLFDVYQESDPDSFYNQIFNSISGGVFGDDSLTPEQNLSLSLISTVVSIGLVLLPVLLVIGFLLRCFRL